MNINDLPEWSDNLGNLIHADCEYYPKHTLDPVAVQSWYNPLDWRVGYVLNLERYEAYGYKRRLEYKARCISHYAGYEFRKTPVPSTGRYFNKVEPKTSFGIIREVTHNEYCDQEYKDLKLVRAKRKDYLKSYHVHDYDDYYDRYSTKGRSWKRTKKHKQYQ